LRKIIGSIAQGNPFITRSDDEVKKVDMIDVGLFIVKKPQNSTIWSGKLEENFIFDFCKETLFNSNFFKKSFGHLYNESLTLLYNTLKVLGPKSSEKGLPFQNFFLSCLLNEKFQDRKLRELPFIRDTLEKGMELPEWMDAIFKCTSVVTSDSPATDVKLFNGKPVDKILIPSKPMLLDGLLNLKGGDGIIVITFGVKTSYETIGGTESNDNFYSTDLNNIYKEKDVVTKYVAEKKRVDKWYGTRIVGRIRICIGFPNTTTPYPSSYNPDNETLFIELKESNIHLLMDNEEVLEMLKGLLFVPLKVIPTVEVESKKIRCRLCGLPGHYQKKCESVERNYKKRKTDLLDMDNEIL
jgi:hypothetical protein